jgi:hypothetical protein
VSRDTSSDRGSGGGHDAVGPLVGSERGDGAVGDEDHPRVTSSGTFPGWVGLAKGCSHTRAGARGSPAKPFATRRRSPRAASGETASHAHWNEFVKLLTVVALCYSGHQINSEVV